ncbi:MAG: cation:proton antiporter [Tissierella sp.]|uniref:cation:proton antiporter n=1 Tax=Tissierella sp. TaxID=41274 RepID=UPI003F9A01EA
MEVLLKLGIIIFMGMVGGKLAGLFKLPNVSGYIVGGLLIGPSLLNIIKVGEADSFKVLNDFALAAIAFSIGNEFLWDHIKKIGKNIMIITLAQALGTIAIVFFTMYTIFNQELGFSLITASIAAATAPAGIVLVIRQLKAKGPLVDTILPVVAIDDAVGLMAFGISLSVVKLMELGGEFSVLSMISSPLIEIAGSLLLGAVLGFLLSLLSKKAKGKEDLLTMVLGFIIIGASVSEMLNLSALLTCMMIGAMVINLVKNANRIFDIVNDFTPPIYVLFFTLAGASLNISVLSTVGFIGVGYIIARTLGKIVGSGIGAKVVKAPSNVVKYLGMTLLPSGGIPIGLALIVANELPSIGEAVTTIVLFSILIFDIIGPILTRIGIVNSGEENGALKKA